MNSIARSMRLVKEYVDQLKLDLSGLIVLTEAASGNYVYTPLIAAEAGAARVIAVTRNSRYGKASYVGKETQQLAESFGIEKGKIKLVNLSPRFIREADIITNLGFLRPINREFIASLKRTAVIPLMYETWEFREEDIDLRECWKRGIPVLGTNEEHEDLRIFDYIGHLCMKILFEEQIEIFRSRIVLVGDNRFSKNIVQTLSAAGAKTLWITEASEPAVRKLGGTKIGCSLKEASAQSRVSGCDAIILNTYPDRRVTIGDRGEISAERLKELASGVIVVQLNGMIERESLDRLRITCLPNKDPGIGHMGWTLADLGPKPVIALNSAGLKVGELLAKARLKGLDPTEAEHRALRNNICQDFSPEQRMKYVHNMASN